jgi:hypothetical protein
LSTFLLAQRIDSAVAALAAGAEMIDTGNNERTIARRSANALFFFKVTAPEY